MAAFLALSGVVFAVFFLVAWFASGGDTPDYAATNQDWTTWADDNQWKSRIGAFLMLLAGFVFLHYAGMVRSVLGAAETKARNAVQLAHVAFAGALGGHRRNGDRDRHNRAARLRVPTWTRW